MRMGLVLLFAVLVGRFWHPYNGFTQFLQIDVRMASVMVPWLREVPVSVQKQPGSYDGGYYAQIATAPSLRDPALKTAIDDPGYRARRILLAAAAWALGGGEPRAVVHAYACLNIALWLVLAVVLWRVFPVDTLRGNLAWAALLFGAGTLFSVRFSLTDLTAMLLLAGATLLVERNRQGVAATLIGAGALARETAVLGAVTFWNGIADVARTRARAVLWLGLALLPLAGWLLYVRHALGSSGAGLGNLGWPLTGWFARWSELLGGFDATGNPRLVIESVLEHVALAVQVVYLLWRRQPDCPWWRLGAAYVVLFVVLGHAVWGGFPNAATRVLLPLTLAFNVRVVRDRARLVWLLLGNLSVFAGLHALWQPPGTPNQLPAHSTWESRHLLETDEHWSVAEWNRKHRWAWCAEAGGLNFRAWPHRERVRLQLEMRGVTPRELQVLHAGRLVWEGRIGDRPGWITLPELPMERGQLQLELRSPAPPTAEGEANTAREISIACFGARVVE